MAGRRPLPSRVKQARGNPGKRELNRAEPQPRAGRPTRPGWLAEEAKREWARIVPELEELGLLTVVDRAALSGYCQWWARYRQAEEALERDGPVVEIMTRGGPMQVQSPWVSLSKQASEACRRFLVEFGLTPASRSRLKVQKPQPEDPVLRLLGRRQGTAPGAGGDGGT